MAYITEQNLTDVVLKRWQDIPDPRLKEVMQSLIKHLHAFVRDIEPTEAEVEYRRELKDYRQKRVEAEEQAGKNERADQDPATLPNPHESERDKRPNKIELLFYGQRPQMFEERRTSDEVKV